MNKALVFLLLAIALGVRVFRLAEPPLEFHQSRQYLGAIVARADYFEQTPSVPEWRRDVAEFEKQHQELLEPQIVPALGAWGYRLAGGVHLWIPRLISVVFWLIGGIFLWKIGERWLSPRAALVSLAFYLLMPFSIIATRVIQSDPLMVAMIVWALYLVLAYDEEPTTRRFAAAVAVLTAGMLVRPMCAVFVFPVFFFLSAQRLGFVPAILNLRTVLFAVVPLAPAVAFYLYSASKGGFIKEQSSFACMPHLLLEPFFWRGWSIMIGRAVGWIPFVAGLLAAVLSPRGRYKMLLLGLFFGYLAYGLVFNYNIHTHDYYSLPLVPIVALAVGVVAEQALKYAGEMSAQRRRVALFAGLIVLVGLGAGALLTKKLLGKNVSPELKETMNSAGNLVGFNKKFLSFLGREDAANRALVEDAEQIGQLMNHSKKTLFLADDDGKALLYHGEFGGGRWPTSGMVKNARMEGRAPMPETVEDFEAFAKKWQAEYFVVTNLPDFTAQTALQNYVSATYPVLAKSDRFVVFRLTKP